MLATTVDHAYPATRPVQVDPDAVTCRMTLAEMPQVVVVLGHAGDPPLPAGSPRRPSS